MDSNNKQFVDSSNTGKTRRLFAGGYLWLRKYVFGGRGLSKIKFIRNANFRLEKWLKGKPEEKLERFGLTIFLDPRGSVSSKLHEFRPESTTVLKIHLRPGDVFVDVGASIGWFTLLAAQAVGKSGKVYAFEPEPHSFGLLQKNIAANGFGDIVSAKQEAVSDKNGHVTLYSVGNAYAWSSLEDPRTDYERKIESNFGKGEDRTVYEHTVQEVRLDSVLQSRVDFIKIDISTGGQLLERALHGTTRILERNPNLKLLLTHPEEEIVRFLEQFGYMYQHLDTNNAFFTKHV
jgi:FkbM family methyltransferase